MIILRLIVALDHTMARRKSGVWRRADAWQLMARAKSLFGLSNGFPKLDGAKCSPLRVQIRVSPYIVRLLEDDSLADKRGCH
jgi:hypothetical protein